MKCQKIQLQTNSFLNWVLQNKDNCHSLPFYTIDMMLDQILSSYEVIFDNQNKDKNYVYQSLSKFNDKDYDKESKVKLLINLVKENKSFFKHFIIQGSYGDMTFVKNWSDFDAIAIIKNDSIEKPNRRHFLTITKKIEKLLREIDMHQHHGVLYIHEKELINYPALYYPPYLYKDAKCILQSKNIKYSPACTVEFEKDRLINLLNLLKSAGKEGVLRHHMKDGKYLLENYKDIDTMYQMKYFLSIVMLLPVYWMNFLGVYCTKKESFKLINNHFSDQDLELITKASLIRNECKHKYEKNKIPEFIVRNLGYDYLKRGKDLAEKFEKQVNERLRCRN